MKTHNILVIENQKSQFDKIAARLGEYTVFPEDEKDFSRVMGWVHVFLNKRYKHDRRTRMFAKLVEYIIDKRISLFVIDYKLTGCHDGQSGLSLAINLQSNFSHILTIFLSRTVRNEPEIVDNLSSILKHEWVDKGYAGMSILEASYFERNVLAKIPPYKDPLLQMYLDKIDQLLKFGVYLERKEEFEQLKNRAQQQGEFTEAARQAIDELRKVEKGFTDAEIKTLLNRALL